MPDLDQQTGERIAEELECLPLALEQAAAYMDQTQLSPAEYLELLQARAAEMHAQGRAGDRPDTIATLWDLSLEKITQENLAAVQLLDICAYLAPRPVPLDLFTGHPDQLPEPLAAAAADRLAFTDTVAVIVDYSLAKRTRPGCSCTGWSRPPSAPATPGRPPPERPGDPDAHGRRLSRLRRWRWRWGCCGPMRRERSWARRRTGPGGRCCCRTCWPPPACPASLRPGPALDGCGRRMQSVVAAGPRPRPTCRSHARLARRRRPLAERALAIDEAALGPDHPDVAVRLNNLAAIVRDLGLAGRRGRWPSGRWPSTEAALGPDHPDVAIRLSNLALILRDLGRPGRRGRWPSGRWPSPRRRYGPDHPDRRHPPEQPGRDPAGSGAGRAGAAAGRAGAGHR